MGNREYMDYKYIMQDISNVYIGAKYTYEDLIEEEDIPFKIKTLVNHYIKPELKGENLSLESHFYYMEKSGFVYQTFQQLKTRLKVSILREKRGRTQYETEIWKLEDFVQVPPKEKEEQGVVIQEIIFSKMALMTI